MRINRFLPLLIPLLILALCEIIFVWPKLVYVSLVVAILLIFFAVRQFTLASEKKENWRNFIILPAVFFLGLAVFSMIVPSRRLAQILFVFNSFFLYFYFRLIYYYLIRTEKYQKKSLENISSYGNFLSFYFIASAVYGLQSFLNAPLWFLMAIIIAVSAAIAYQVMWANRVNLELGLFYILLLCLVLLEFAWCISFLTLSYYILGLILAVCYYVLIGLTRFYLLGELDKKKVKQYLVFGLASVLLVILTARWI